MKRLNIIHVSKTMSVVQGDLLEAKGYIAHQCNCVTKKSLGLAKAIFDKYKHANVYKRRKEPSMPGTIEVCGNIINMFGQFYPGKKESAKKRIEYFLSCLEEITKLKLEGQISFPYKIGCGLAGGDWTIYQDMIEKFAEKNQQLKVFIVKL